MESDGLHGRMKHSVRVVGIICSSPAFPLLAVTQTVAALTSARSWSWRVRVRVRRGQT